MMLEWIKMNAKVNIPTMHLNLSPEAFHLYACQYLKCKTEFKYSLFSPVPYFLLCRAIELELKSRHLNVKSQRQVKDDYSHNLKKAYIDLNPAQQVLNADEMQTLEKANDIYKSKGFEYFSPHYAMTGYDRYPNLDTLEIIAKKLIENSHLHDETFKKNYAIG
jgi:hypothetical protein